MGELLLFEIPILFGESTNQLTPAFLSLTIPLPNRREHNITLNNGFFDVLIYNRLSSQWMKQPTCVQPEKTKGKLSK
jgi:hypothetical protein